MGSHYLFFNPKEGHKFIDVMRPRVRTGEKPKAFSFEIQFRPEYGDFGLFVMDNSQRQRLMGEIGGDNVESRKTPIYTVKDMVLAELIDFTSKTVPQGTRAFRTDFYNPSSTKFFAYATPYGQGTFGRQHLARTGDKLEMLKFEGYQIGQPISKAIKSSFLTYYNALRNNENFSQFKGMDLALVVSGKLIERE